MARVPKYAFAPRAKAGARSGARGEDSTAGEPKKSPAEAGLFNLEAEVGIEPAYADLQSAA
jgi:hypothetical protein